MAKDQTDKFVEKYIGNDSKMRKYYNDAQTTLMIGVKVRELRESMNMTQAEFAELVGKPKSTIGRIETGATNAKIETLQDIANAANHKLKIEFV